MANEANESTQWLYDQLKGKGYNVGKDVNEFDNLMRTNAESRQWAYDTATKSGLNVGKDINEFSSLVGGVSTAAPTPKPAEAPAPVEQPQADAWRPSPMQQAALRMQINSGNARLRQQGEQFKQRTENIMKGNKSGAFMGERELNPQTGEMETKYYTRQGSQTDTQLEQSRENTEYRRWWEDNTEAGQRSKALRLKNEKERQLDEMQADVDSRIEQNEENLHDLYGQRAKQLDEGGKWNDDEGFWSNFVRIVGGATNRGVTANAPKAKESKTKAAKDISTYLAENQILEDARKMLETRDLKRSNGFMGGFWNIPNNLRNMKRGAAHTLSDPDLYAGGVVALEKASQMLGIEDKLKQGEDLSDAELNLVYSSMLGQDIHSNTKTPHGYNVAQITVEMAPFLVQMMTNPASGLSRAMVTKFGKSGLKKIALSKTAQGLTGEAAEQFAKKEMRKLAVKTTGVQVLGDLGESAVLANTWQAPQTAADAMGRYQGNVTQDANGNIVFDGNHQLGEAIYKAEASAIIENYTEMLGEHFGIIGNVAKKGVDKGLRAIGGGKMVDAVSDMVSKIGASEWGTAITNIEKRAHWNGTVNEVLEEEAGIVLNSLFTGDNKLSDLTDKDQQIDIVLGVGLFGGFVSGVKTTGYMVGKARSEGKLHERDRIGKARFGDNWDSIREAIQEAEEKDLGTTIQDLTQNFAESNEQARSIVEYAQALMRARGFNIASASVRAQNSEPDNAIEAEVTQSYTDGYEALTSQEMNDAQNMYEHQRQRAEGMFDTSMLDRLDANPADALTDMLQNGLYPQEEIDAALDYINAKMTRDGIIQRVNDDIDEQIAQSHAMINARVNPATGMIQPATIGLDDRQVYVVGGKIAVNGEGKVDRDASDESIIIRDAQTGHLEFTDLKSIVSVGEPIDPDMERDMAVDGIRQQAAQAAADAMNGTLAFNPGDVVTINDGGELVQCTIVGPLIDESTGKPAEDLLDVRFPDGSQIAFTKEQLQQSVDALNRERIEGVDRERTAARAQQRAAEAEAMRPKFALNDEFTILNDAGIPIRGSVTSEIDEDGTVEIYTEEPINGNKVNHFTPAELEEMIDTYNGSPTQDVSAEEAVLSEEDSLTLPTDNDTNDGYGNGPQQDNDTATWSEGEDSVRPVASDAAGSVASNRDRSTIRSYEEGLANRHHDHSDDSERNRRDAESERLVGIAKANGQYFDPERKTSLGIRNPKGTGESEVYRDFSTHKVYKVKDPYAKSPMKGDVQPEDVIYEHLVHNKYFPETAYGFEGISDDMGDVRIVLSQNYVQSVGQPTKEQIESALAEKGLLPEGRYTYGNEEISVTDVTGDNALLGADGKVYFIDPIINFKKPVREILGETEESPQEEITALQRIPRDAEGRPDYEAADTETAWDALVESAKGNEERAKRVAEGMVKQKRTELERVKKLTPPNPGKGKYLSPEELIEWEESHDAMTEGAEAALAKWIAVGRVQQDRQAAAKKAADEERQRQAAELWEQQKEQQRQEEAARKTAEAEAEARRSEIAAQQAIAEKEAAGRRDSHIGKAESAFDEYLQQLRDDVVSRHITPEYRKQMEREDRAKGPSQYASMYANWESPQSLEEYIARVLSTNDKRVKWSGAGNLAGELYGQEKMSERKEHSWMTSDTNGMSFAKFIHGIWEGLIGENGVSFNNHVYTDQDVRNAVIDALRSNPTSRGLYEQALNMHRSNGNDNMQLRSELDELLMHEDEIRDEWYNEHFHMSAEEYEAAEEQMLASIRESGITDEDICAMASETIDEYINSNYYGTERNQGSNQVLSGTQIDDTIGGEEAVGDRPEASGGTGIDDDATESTSDSGQVSEVAAVIDYTTKAPLAFDYYTDGLGVVKSTEFLLMAVAGAFPRAASSINAIANKYRSVIIENADPSRFVLSKIGSAIHKEIRAAVQEAYNGNNKASNMVSYMFNNPTGIIPSEAQVFQQRIDQLENTAKRHDLSDLDTSAIAERIDIADDDWTEGEGNNLIYKRTITIDGKHKVIQVDEPDSNGFYTGSYFEFNGGRFGDLSEVISHIDKQAKLAADIAVAESEVNTDPTPGQKEAGNYKKGHVQVGTFDVTIEQPVGSVRCGKDADGKEWETTMQNTYGYIRGTESVDGDHIDVFLSTDIDAWNGRRVVIVDQYNPDGSFDEHKVMLGFNEKSDAINAYLANYEKGWEKGRRLVFSTATLEDFEKWIESSHRKQKPYHEYKIADKAEVDESTPENPVSATDYTINTYTTKKNKTYHRVVFPRADKEVWQERLNLAKKMGGTSVPKGYGFKTREEAEAFAKAVANPETVADAQPLSLEDMRPTTGMAQVDVEGLMTQLSETDEANLADFSTPVKSDEAKPATDKPVNPSGNKLVTDERYAELRERMRKKLGGQLNMGVDPEILAIGTEMAVYHIEKGARKFKAYASAMIADLGDAIRPYLKAFYNAVRDMPEAEAAGLVADMDSYDEVRNVDIANFDKPGTDAMATAAAVVAEQEAESQKAEAERKLQAYRHLVNKYAQDIANSPMFKKAVSINDSENVNGVGIDLYKYYVGEDITSIAENSLYQMFTDQWNADDGVLQSAILAEAIRKAHKAIQQDNTVVNPDGTTTETVVEDGTEIAVTTGDFIPGVKPTADNEKKPGGKKKPGKPKPRPTTDGGLFDTVEDETASAPSIIVPEPRPAADLMGDSSAYQDRGAQTAELVEEIGGVIESRVMMLQLDAESVKPLTMTEVKKMASKYSALNGISDTDLQELVELAMTQLTRSEAIIKIDGTAEQQRAAFDHIVNLYQIQPSLNARDSERLIKQQYSTPTPFGYVMGQFVRAGGKTVGSMLEPSAGNGALTITVHPSLVHVNDIDEARLANLRKLGYAQVTAQDALLPFGGDKVDVVMTNPPFGTVAEKEYDGVFRISSLEGQMAINALEQMKDDGRAAIVIGGNTSYRTNGSMNPKDAAFFGYLYSHYNVADVINISGKALYSRNGTGYDVRMILIDGRKTGEFQRVFPPVKAKARAEQVTTFDELYKRVQDDIQQIQQVGSQSADVQREPETTTDGTASAPIRSGSNRPNSGAGQRPGTTGDAVRDTPRTDSGQSATVDDGSRPVGVDNAVSGDAGSSDNVPQPKPQQPRSVGGASTQNGTGRSGSDGRGAATSRPDSSTERLAVKPDLTTEKVPYPNQSGNGFTLMSVVPAAQAQVLQKSLGEIGDVDQYLVDELGYSSKEELYSYLAAEQIDSVALAIHQMNKGNAFIIGDMTGVGKGRQGAALIRYAVKQGKVPIYFTQKPTLFTDNYRDLADIGSSDLRPFIIASNPKDANIVDADGNIVHKLPSKKEQERVFAYIMEHGTLPDEYDYVLTTYDQIKNGTADYAQNEDGTWNTEARKLPKKSKGYTTADYNGQTRRDALAKLAEGNIAILDESHTVGGDSGCGRYMQMLTSSAGGVTFLSATFAKRADNMPIYAQRTAIAEAEVKASELIDAIMKGGVTLQEIMSKQLVESGQMIRRERSFEGVTIDWLSVEEETDRRQRAQFDEVAAIFNAIRNFQDDYITPIIDAKNEAAAEWGATVGHTQGTKDMGVKNVPFASKMYNLVNQLLFALKVDAVADRVVENLRNGYKPVISFTNTMEGFLSSAPKGVAMDEVPNFSLTLMRALDGVMRFTEKDADENTEGGSISLSELSAEGQKSYNAIRDKIMNLAADLPISPMDAIRMKIEEAGYSVAEITGRTMQLNRTEDGKYIVEARKDRDKKAAMRDFNSGKLDVLMINKSGSTGISLHASSKFEDQRQRVMVFAQFQSDINDEVQMRGRIDRSGQVTRGRYEYIMSTIPAEQRIQMMFKAKLKSLDANTTSSQKSKFNEMEIVDYLNKYGDEVVWEYMKEHPELEERLGDPLDMLQEKNSEDGPRTSEKEDTSKKTGCAGKISRYLAFLSVDEQDEIFKEITEAYRVKIQLLDDAGENDLEITTMPLRAETKRKQIWHEGVNPGSGNAFADNTYAEEVEVDVLKKPMKRDEIIEAIRKLAGNLYLERNGVIDWAHYTYNKGEEIHQFYQAKADEAFGKMKEAGEARIAKAREKAVAAATKARGRGENNFTDAEIQSLADTVANEEREKEEQKQNKRHNEIMAVNNRIQALLTRLRAGSIYVVPQDLKQGTPEMFSQTFGTFVGFKFNKSYTLGSSTAIFATLDGRRKVELALSDPAINTIISATEMAYRYSPKEINAITMENWDSNVPTQTRQKRYIITGNLLQALVDTEKGEKTRGNLISYSTIDGETRQGILMGENFKLTDLRNSATLSSLLAQIREGKAVVSENGDVQISKEFYDWRHRGEYELRVPKSKQRGGIYTMHPGLLKLVEGNNFITKGNNMIAYVTEENIANVVDMLSRAPFNLTVLQESQLTDTEFLQRQGDGYGAYTDAEVSFANDPVSKVLGKNRFSKKRQAEFAARERQRMITRVRELADVMHLDNVDIVTDASGLDGKRAKAKGFYNKRTGRITIVIPNNVSTIDAVQTLLHEAVAHYGLRQLFGKQFDTFLDNVYQAADEGIRRRIAEMAAKNGWDFRTATEEYLAELAENTDFRESQYEGGWWDKVKRLFMDFLELIGFADFKEMGVVLTDNELRYLLWRSYANLSEPGRYRSILGEAADVAKQSELKVGNYAEKGTETEYAAEPISEVNDSFNKQLERWVGGQMRPDEIISLGIPKGVMRHFLSDSPILLRQKVLSKSRKKHGLTGLEMINLPGALANPIFVFKSNPETISVLTVLKSRKGENLFVAIELEKDLKFGGNTMVVNDILTVHGRETENVVSPIINNGTLMWVDKEKGLEWLHSAKSKSQAITSQDLSSAANIVNSFENPTIGDDELFRPGDFSPRDQVFARREYERMVSSGSYQFKEAVQDSMLGLKKLYQAILGKGTRIENVPGFENAYLFENRMSSMNAGEQHEYFQRYMQPLLKEIAKIAGADKRKRRELTDYLMAKHGLERNEYMRNEAAANGEETDRDFAGLIGLTGEADWQSAEATAQQWVDDYESSVDTTALWQAINDATKATLEKIYLSGIISKETYEKILGMYQFYIPLRGWNETTSEQVYGYLTSKDGPLGGSIMKKAEGRESMADEPIATIGMMADDAIRQGNRNLMKQRFLNFILNHPSDAVSVHDIWLEYDDVADEWRPVFADVEATDTPDEVAQKVEAFEQRMEALRNAEPDKYKKGREAQHIPYKVVKGNLREHQILIKRNGRTFVATINGNPRAAQALNGLTNPDVDQNGVVGNMLKAGTWINRQLSAFYTTRNPDFVVSNFFRDALYSNCMTWVKESPRYARRFHKNFGRVNPIVMLRLLGKWEKGKLDMSNRLEALFYQFMKNGGETGYTNVRDIEGHKRAVAAELKKQGSTGRRVWTALGMQLDLLNRSAENCARFAAFVTSREFGRSIDRAIYDAKEVSVNFNKKGSGGKMVNANGQTALGKAGAYLGGSGRLLYVFWNAGIQGFTNFGRQAKLHPAKFTVGATALFALGYVIPMLAQMLGGGDGGDDDKNAYYNLPEYIRRSNICFRAGEQWITIPLPIEYRAMYGMGELAHGVISGNERYTDAELGRQMAAQISQIMPLDMLEGGGGISPFIPSAAKPFTEAYIMNKSWTGLPVYKDTPFNKNEPEWTKAYASADKHLVAFAKWLNETSGGDDFKKGAIDINPAKIEYLLNGTFGGMFTFPNKFKKSIETAAGSRDFEWRNMPIANRLIKSGDERTANRKLQNEYFKYLKEYEATGQLMRKYENADEDGIMGYAERINVLENSPEYARWEIFDEFKPNIDAYREDIAEETDKEERAKLEAEMYAVMRELVNALHNPEAYRNSEQQ